MTRDLWAEKAESFYDDAASSRWSVSDLRTFARAYRRVSKLLPPNRSTPLLDLGCGCGHLTAALSSESRQIVGIDLSRSSLRIAFERSPGYPFLSADMTALPFPDASFSAATAFTSLEFCADRQGALREASRILKPGGIFILEVRNAGFALFQLPGPLLALFHRLGWIVPYEADEFRDLKDSEWTAMIPQAGLTVLRKVTSLRPWNYGTLITRIKNLLIRIVAVCLPLRHHYMITYVCEKKP